MVYIVFGDLKLPSLIAGPINLCKYFPVACVISQIIFKFRFFLQYACLCELCRFSLRGSHILQIHFMKCAYRGSNGGNRYGSCESDMRLWSGQLWRGL